MTDTDLVAAKQAKLSTPEDAFRLWAFHAYYAAYKAEQSPTMRFVRALVASAKPIPPDRIRAWRLAKKEIARATKRLNRNEIDRAHWAELIQAAILTHTGKVIRERAWQISATEEGSNDD